MSKIEYLLQQAARAERLAKNVLDTLTVERLQAFAAECRAQARALSERRLAAYFDPAAHIDVGCRSNAREKGHGFAAIHFDQRR